MKYRFYIELFTSYIVLLICLKSSIMRSLTLLSLFLLSTLSLFSATKVDTIPTHIVKKTVIYANRDTCDLKMDIYRLKEAYYPQPVMLFIFGGAFMFGSRDREDYVPYLLKMAEEGFTTISIDYRLGLKGKKISIFNTSNVDEAIDASVEDLFSATKYLLDNAARLVIDTSLIIVSGSSAGGITALQADYMLKNNMPLAQILPQNFSYQGIISYSGAIFSHKGTPDYQRPPSPTLFIHGDKDPVVKYNALRIFKLGLFGSKSLATRFKKRGHTYAFLTMKGRDHSVSDTAMHDNFGEIMWFINEYIFKSQNRQTDLIMQEQ